MTEKETNQLRQIRRALLSVSDKTGLVEFARGWRELGAEVVSTGGTAKALREAGLEVRDVSEVTGFPEMLDGRVKTLHPRIHGGILAVRDNPEHTRALAEHEIATIDMVVVNLYPFEQTVARAGVTHEEAVEQIDIGGPAMVRSAAKNFTDVAVVTTPDLYPLITQELTQNGGLSLKPRARLARRAFMHTSGYDQAITSYLFSALSEKFGEAWELQTPLPLDEILLTMAGGDQVVPILVQYPEQVSLPLEKCSDLRYGENPHQSAALYTLSEETGIARAELLGGKEMSFNNYVDADAACQLVCDFEETACAINKHMNPSGVGNGATLEEAYRRALATDPVSAFGGIVAFNRTVDETAARALTEIFTEVVVAPDFEEAAVEVLKSKKNLRILRAGVAREPAGLDFKRVTGGMLVQTRDAHRLRREDLKVVTRREPTAEELDALMFASTVCKHTKSTASVCARGDQPVGVGAGQMSRVDSVRIGAMRAQLPVEGSVLASDAFFPFRDGLDEADKTGLAAIIQPGGSVRDSEVIAAADDHGLAMVFTGIRHFRH